MSRFHLSSAEREALESLLQDTRDAGVYRRVLALLEVDRGRPLAALARLLRVGRRTLYHWLDAYRCSGDAAALVDRRGYVWKRPRYALHPDPEREKKTADLPPGPGQGAARRLAL